MRLDLPALLAPIAFALLPGWTITCAWLAPDAMPIHGALAVCNPTPTRQLAHVDVVQPWPEGESLTETLWHELTHALLSPLTALIPASDGAVMVEEQAVERLGVLLSKLPPMARAAVLRGVDTFGGAPLRARISALAPRARSGGTMDPKIITEALDALIEGNAEKCAELLKGLIASAAGAPPAEAAPPSDAAPAVEAAKVAGPPAPPGAEGGEVSPDARRAKEGDMTDDKEAARARKVLLDGAAEVTAALAIIRPAAKTQIAIGLRARLGASFTPSVEADIMAAPTLAAAQTLATFAEKHLGGGTAGGAQRARSGVEHAQNEGPDHGTAPTVDALRTEGFNENFLVGYVSALRSGADVAHAYLSQGRTNPRARVAQNGAK